MKSAARLSIVFLSFVFLMSGRAVARDAKPFLTLRENLAIGGAEGDAKGISFRRIGAVQVDDSGRIFVLDREDSLVQVFDAKGNPVLTFGKKGQGPGDLQSPSIMTLSGNTLAIADFSNKKIVEFALDGGLRREIDLKWIVGMFGVEDTSPSAIYGNLLLFQDDGSILLRLVRFGLTDRSSLTLHETRMVSNAPKFSPVEPTFLLRLMPDQRIVWAYPGEFALNLLSVEGKLEARRERDDRPVKFTERDREKRLIAMFGGKDKAPGDMMLVWPEHHPPIERLAVSDNGWIIVKTPAKDAQGRSRYDVFENAKADYLGSFYHPAEEILRAWKSGMAYFSGEDDQGYPTVKRYEVQAMK